METKNIEQIINELRVDLSDKEIQKNLNTIFKTKYIDKEITKKDYKFLKNTVKRLLK